jgi:hypothetical protein
VVCKDLVGGDRGVFQVNVTGSATIIEDEAVKPQYIQYLGVGLTTYLKITCIKPQV